MKLFVTIGEGEKKKGRLDPSIESMGALSHSYVGSTSVLPDSQSKSEVSKTEETHHNHTKTSCHYIFWWSIFQV